MIDWRGLNCNRTHYLLTITSFLFLLTSIILQLQGYAVYSVSISEYYDMEHFNPSHHQVHISKKKLLEILVYHGLSNKDST